jgi:hypothetical protein
MAVNTAAFFVNNPDPAKRQVALIPEAAPTDLWGQGTPDGDREPFLSAQKGTLYRQVDASDDYPHLWVKVDEGNDDGDWVLQSAGLTNAPINETSSGLTVTSALHNGKVITLNRAAGIAVVLPAATGSGDKYRFIVGTTFTGAATIKVTGNDIMKGTAILFQDAAETVVAFATAADSDTVTFAADNTTGGVAGASVELIDIAADTWYVAVVSDAAGSEATPFSATV